MRRRLMSPRRWLVGVALVVAGCATSPLPSDTSSADPTTPGPLPATGAGMSGTGPAWPDFRSAVDAVETELARLGYENLGGDHPGPTSVAFLVVGSDGAPEVEVALGWSQAAPMGAFSTIVNTVSGMDGIQRGPGRAGVWFLCGPLYVEMLAGDLPDAASLADRLIDEICRHA